MSAAGLVRPANVALALVGVIVGGVALAGRVPAWGGLAWAALAGALGVAGANALNDALDATVDRSAHPARAVPSGRVAPMDAARIGIGLLVAALAAASVAGFWVLVVASVLAAGVVAYEFRFKREGLLGNVLVSYDAGSLILLGGVAAVAGPLAYAPDDLVAVLVHPRLAHVIVMGLLAGALNLAREVYKDAEDAAHDAAVRRTFAVRHGARAATWMGHGLVLALVPLALVPWRAGLFGDLYAVTLVPLLVLLVVVPFLGGPAQAQRALKVGMVLGFVPFVVTALA